VQTRLNRIQDQQEGSILRMLQFGLGKKVEHPDTPIQEIFRDKRFKDVRRKVEFMERMNLY
jgi:hypothetical protein